MKYKDIPELHGDDLIRFLSSFNAKDMNSCWAWNMRRSAPGYGLFKFNQMEYYAHRVSYSFFTKSLSNVLVLDHKCRNRACVNPNHLRQVTVSVNSSENTLNPLHLNSLKTHCKHGHEFTPDNVLMKSDGRRCRTCKRLAEKGRKRVKRVRT